MFQPGRKSNFITRLIRLALVSDSSETRAPAVVSRPSFGSSGRSARRPSARFKGRWYYWFSGISAPYQLIECLALGGEVFYQTRSTTGGPGSPGYALGSRDSAGFNLGGTYDFSQTSHLLFSGGRGFLNAPTTNEFSYYLALQVTF